MSDTAGSIRKLVLDGIPFDVPGDANISEIGSAYENEGIPTSGRTIIKQTRRVQVRESVTVVANGAERELLQALAERQDNYPMSYQTAGGDTYRTTGRIEFENRETETLNCTLKLIPTAKWDAFIAA